MNFSHQKVECGFPMKFKWLISVMEQGREQGWTTFSTFLLVCDPANGNRGPVAKRNSETESAHKVFGTSPPYLRISISLWIWFQLSLTGPVAKKNLRKASYFIFPTSPSLLLCTFPSTSYDSFYQKLTHEKALVFTIPSTPALIECLSGAKQQASSTLKRVKLPSFTLP